MSWHIYFFSHVILLPDNKQRGKCKKVKWEALQFSLTEKIPTIWANSSVLELNVLGEGSTSSLSCPLGLVIQPVFNPHHCPLIKPIFCQLSTMMTLWERASKTLLKRLGCLHFSTHLENNSRKWGSLNRPRNKMLLPWKLLKQLDKSRTQCIWEDMRKDTNDEISLTQVLSFVHVFPLAGTLSHFLVWSEWQEHRH